MRKMVFILFIATMLLNMNIAFADTFTYPSEDPVFSVYFPDNWKIELDEELLNAEPKDGSIYVGLWALEDADDVETAIEVLADELDQFISDIEAEDPQEVEINNLNVLVIDGKGKVEGTKVEFSVTLFSPDGETFFIGIYFGTPDAIKVHEEALMEIIQSIKAIE